MHDIFYVSKTNGNNADWEQIKSTYPIAQRLSNITSFEEIKSKSFTRMFWVIWDNINLNKFFNLTEYLPTKWDDMYVHVFKNGKTYDGICLFTKSVDVSQREFDNRFFTNKKEIDIVASYPKPFESFEIETYKEYEDAMELCCTDMFWAIWKDVELVDDIKLDYAVPAYDRNVVHIFKNGDHLDGICLFPKNKKISKKEFEHRFFIDKKEIDIKASIPKKYKIYSPATFFEYQQISDQMFWIVWPEIEVTDFGIFDLYFSHHNMYDRRENHSFKHLFNDKEISINGVILCSRQKQFSHKEFQHRFLLEKKENNQLVSKHRIYDVVFISYNEANADENYNILLAKCPRAKRVHGIIGIHQAHIKAAEACTSDMIWVVDGDAVVADNFSFNLVMSTYDIDCVHVWRSRNPINDLEYGNGGIKLLPRQMTLNMDVNSPDMTTSISKKFKAVDAVSNITAFNTDEFTTWRSAFRECAKLSSRVIERQYEEETEIRLNTWCTAGANRMFGNYAVSGAKLGKAYGLENKNNPAALRMINDFEWLKEQFHKHE